MEKGLTRRAAIKRGLQLSAGGGIMLGLSACGDEDAAALVCADPDSLSTADASVRRSLNYVELSGDSSRVCAGCDFFKAGTASGSCGSCEIFGGGPVNPAGRCDSWSVDA